MRYENLHDLLDLSRTDLSVIIKRRDAEPATKPELEGLALTPSMHLFLESMYGGCDKLPDVVCGINIIDPNESLREIFSIKDENSYLITASVALGRKKEAVESTHLIVSMNDITVIYTACEELGVNGSKSRSITETFIIKDGTSESVATDTMNSGVYTNYEAVVESLSEITNWDRAFDPICRNCKVINRNMR